MDGIVFKRCGCSQVVVDTDGVPVRGTDGRVRRRQLGASCPQLHGPDGFWSPTHGSWFYQLDDPVSAVSGRSYFRRGGFATRDEAWAELATVHKLLEAAQLAVDPATARAAIGTAVHAAIAAGRLLFCQGFHCTPFE